MARKPPIEESRSGIGALTLALVVAGAFVVLYFAEFEYAYIPLVDNVAPAPRLAAPAYDLWGESIWPEEAERIQATPQGRERLSPRNGAVPIDASVLEQGRNAFYRETFGSEVFLTDVLGMLDGPLDLWAMTRALIAFGGRGTDNLQVPLSRGAVVGGRRFQAGELIGTGLDVPRGAFVPLGINIRYPRGRILAGISCALCHATVDPETYRVIEGAPNINFNVGTLMALAPNSAAYFANTDAHPKNFGARPPATPPDRQKLEDAVDEVLLNWPPGYFDSTIDLVANPTQVPDSFTLGDHPYGWNGSRPAGRSMD